MKINNFCFLLEKAETQRLSKYYSYEVNCKILWKKRQCTDVSSWKGWKLLPLRMRSPCSLPAEQSTCQHLGYSQSRSRPSKLCLVMKAKACSTNARLFSSEFTSLLYLLPDIFKTKYRNIKHKIECKTVLCVYCTVSHSYCKKSRH